MTVSLEIEVKGAEEAAARLGEIGESISRGIAEALREGAELIVNAAQSNAPVDTGFLRDSIEVTEESDTSVTVVAGAPYAGYVEYGTSRSRAQPYFEPAIEQAKPEILQLLRDALSNSG